MKSRPCYNVVITDATAVPVITSENGTRLMFTSIILSRFAVYISPPPALPFVSHVQYPRLLHHPPTTAQDCTVH